MTLTLLVSLSACYRAPCDVEAALEPGCGLQVDDLDVHLGDELERLERKLGEPQSRSDYGPLGLRVAWAGDVSVFVDDLGLVTSVRVGASFGGQTTDGLGVGSTQDAVSAALGEPHVDPMLGSWWYADPGIGFEWDEGVATRVVIGSP